MEPVFTVQHGHEPPVVPPPHHGPGRQMEGQGRRGWARPVVALLVVLGVTVGFAFGVHRARHSARDLAFAIVTYYLFLVLVCCVVKLRLYPPATAVERRRVRICAWVLSVALGLAATARVADAVHGLALKLVVWGISIVLHGIGLYFFLRKGADDERSDAEELGRGLSPPEEKV